MKLRFKFRPELQQKIIKEEKGAHVDERDHVFGHLIVGNYYLEINGVPCVSLIETSHPCSCDMDADYHEKHLEKLTKLIGLGEHAHLNQVILDVRVNANRFKYKMELWNPTPFPGPGPEPGDIASILYTSGPTLRPRGVMLSHEHLVKAASTGADFLNQLRLDPLHGLVLFGCLHRLASNFDL